MQGWIGKGDLAARRWMAGACLLAAVTTFAALTAGPASGGADARQKARGHAPKVTITKGPPGKTKKHSAKFKFKSDKQKTKFKCKVDGGSYQSCSSPRKVSVGKGTHTFSVYGVNLGVPGPPDTRKWKVVGKSARDGAGARHHLPQNYVFNGGPGAALNGLVISANGPAGCALAYCLVKEETLGADGAVIGGGPYPDCNAEYHYHGFLFEQPDQPSGCGWGTVSPFGTTEPSELRGTAIAITLETAALQADKPKNARKQLGVALEQLNAAAQNPALDVASAAALSQAAQLDAQADVQLAKAAAQKGKRRGKKMKKAGKLIEEALALKRQVYDRLVYGV
jgi:hypothetical protein